MGGGVHATGPAGQPAQATTVLNSIVANSTSGGGVAREGVPLVTQYCDVWANAGGDYVNCAASPLDVSADPLYCDPANRDLTLRDDSPCLPVGNPWGVLIGAYDAGGCGTSVADEASTQLPLRLAPPSPNPSGGTVALTCVVGDPGVVVDLEVLTPAGRLVRAYSIPCGSAGTHTITWDGTDETGHRVASGAYVVKATAGARTCLRGVVILRGRG